MIKKFVFISLLLMAFSLFSCSNENDLSAAELNNHLIDNYKKYYTQFEKMKRVIDSRYIRQIGISFDDNFSLLYVTIDSNGKESWHNISDFKTGRDKVNDYLKLNDLSMAEVLDVASSLKASECIRLNKNDLFDRYNGLTNNCIDLLCKRENRGLQVYYRMFNKPLDSISGVFTRDLIAEDHGNIIDQYTLWYVR